MTPFEREQRMAEQMAKADGYWIPMMQVFDLGVPGPSGNENDTYVADDSIYKVTQVPHVLNLLILGSLRSKSQENLFSKSKENLFSPRAAIDF